MSCAVYLCCGAHVPHAYSVLHLFSTSVSVFGVACIVCTPPLRCNAVTRVAWREYVTWLLLRPPPLVSPCIPFAVRGCVEDANRTMHSRLAVCLDGVTLYSSCLLHAFCFCLLCTGFKRHAPCDRLPKHSLRLFSFPIPGLRIICK